MAGYVSPPPPHPLGRHRPEIEAKREQLGLDERGFRLDKGDPVESEKEQMLREIYRRENEKLPYAIGGGPADAGDDDTD